ncbi:MAG: RNA polymerase factor sigma-54 [Victivallaceae bacterium]|nr:RNA polymerase factor sigma-54 [Victivallaceae bacterium]
MADTFLSQNIEQKQEQILARHQIQSLEVLLTPLLELQEKIDQELNTNPVIEQEKSSIEELAGDPLHSATPDSDDREKHRDDENDFSEILKIAESWNGRENFNNYNSSPDDAQSKRDFMFNSLVEQPSLQQQLLEQLSLSNCSPQLVPAAEFVIGSIDGVGYLTTAPEDIAAAAKCDVKQIRQAIKLVQSFDPPGIGARDLRECLLLQLDRRRQPDPELRKLISGHLEEIGRNRLPQVAKAMGISIAELNVLIARLREFTPLPGSALSPSSDLYILPELTVEKKGNEYAIISNDNYLPRLKISQTYLDLLENPDTNAETRSYIKEKLLAARMLIKSLTQRQSTIRRIAQVIVDTQYDFLEKGVEGLKPLTMQQVADKLGLHETTISRAIANKYLKTPNGIYEFKFFFSGGYQTEDGEEISSRGIKEKIKDLIADEDKSKPLSDNKLSQLLRAEGLNVARRTVAKYREQLGIAATNLRRTF